HSVRTTASVVVLDSEFDDNHVRLQTTLPYALTDGAGAGVTLPGSSGRAPAPPRAGRSWRTAPPLRGRAARQDRPSGSAWLAASWSPSWRRPSLPAWVSSDQSLRPRPADQAAQVAQGAGHPCRRPG